MLGRPPPKRTQGMAINPRLIQAYRPRPGHLFTGQHSLDPSQETINRGTILAGPGFFFCGKSSDPPPKRTQGTATNPRLIQVWSGPGQPLGQCLAYTTVRSEQQGATKYPFSWDEGDGTGEPRLLAGSSEASKASTSVEQNHKGSPRTAVGHSSEKSPP